MNPIVNKLKRITSFHAGPSRYSDLEVDAGHLAMIKSRILNHAFSNQSLHLGSKPHEMISSSLDGSETFFETVEVGVLDSVDSAYAASKDELVGDLMVVDAVSGRLTYGAFQDYEIPIDGNGDDVYEVEVRVANPNGGHRSQLVTVSIADATASAAGLFAGWEQDVGGQSAKRLEIGRLGKRGRDDINYSIVGGLDASAFSIREGRLLLSEDVLELAAIRSFHVIVRAVDSHNRYFDKVLKVEIGELDDTPSLQFNIPFSVEAGFVHIITSSELSATDPESPPSSIVYTVIHDVDHGTLSLGPDDIHEGDTFTQFDINIGNLTYQHDGSRTSKDHFNFVVTDITANTLNPKSLDISVNPTYDGESQGRNDSSEPVLAAIPVFADKNSSFKNKKVATLIGAPKQAVAFRFEHDGSFTYHPKADFFGEDRFTFGIANGVERNNVACVTIVYKPWAAQAEGDQTGARLSEIIHSKVKYKDPLNGAFETFPTYGVATILNEASFQYISASEYFETDSFSFQSVYIQEGKHHPVLVEVSISFGDQTQNDDDLGWRDTRNEVRENQDSIENVLGDLIAERLITRSELCSLFESSLLVESEYAFNEALNRAMANRCGPIYSLDAGKLWDDLDGSTHSASDFINNFSLSITAISTEKNSGYVLWGMYGGTLLATTVSNFSQRWQQV